MLAAETRRTEWGTEISAALVRDFIHTGIRHDALSDYVNEYIFDIARNGDGELPADAADALRLAIDEILDTARPADWHQVALDLLDSAHEFLQELADTPTVAVAAPAAVRERLQLRDDARARGRRGTANRILDAIEELSREQPDRKLIMREIAARAKVSIGTFFAQFGDLPGMFAALNARRALRIPALWADLGCSEANTAISKIPATGREYLRLSLEHPDAFRAIVLPCDPGSSRTCRELTELLAQRIADQHALLADAIQRGVTDGSLRSVDARQTAELLWTAWTGVVTLAWRGDGLRPDEETQSRQLAATTDALLNGLRARRAGMLGERRAET